MEGLYINLIKKQPINYLRLIAGVIMTGAALYLAFFTQQERFSALHLTLFCAAGLYYALMGIGLNPLNLMGKAYIIVNQQMITVKKSIFTKAIVIDWTTIEELQVNITAIRIKRKNGEPFSFDYQMLDEDTAHELKTRLALTAKKQGITVS
ncbi:MULTISPECIES: hypothetical protein [unclassified Carboxylicivirga]|uniref:hypothetical protein n=1 Tax=Carboxylicivirga TaxID=1628153 RepID=UPI003D33C309